MGSFFLIRRACKWLNPWSGQRHGFDWEQVKTAWRKLSVSLTAAPDPCGGYRGRAFLPRDEKCCGLDRCGGSPGIGGARCAASIATSGFPVTVADPADLQTPANRVGTYLARCAGDGMEDERGGADYPWIRYRDLSYER